MEYQQDYKIVRIAFLKKFTEEIIKNLAKAHESKLRIDTEKIKRKFIYQDNKHPEEFKKIINHKILHPLKYPKQALKEKKGIIIKRPIQNPISQLEYIPKPRDIDPEKLNVLQSIKPEYKPKPQDLVLGKLDLLLKDNMIQTLECPGPGKNILVKKLNKINVTKITLSQEEINAIITEFSNKAKIPLLGGILKTAIGNMLISAITSDFAGSRFIINKINPVFQPTSSFR